MYNRYIPNGTAYTRVVEEDAPALRRPAPPHETQPEQEPRHTHQQPHQAHQQTHRQAEPHPHQPPPGEKKASPLAGLLKSFKLDDLDTGDILLLLILVFLVLDGDGDNLELIITLGLVVLFTMGDKKKEKNQEPG